MNYTIHWTDSVPPFEGQWEQDVWKRTAAIQVNQFHPRSSEHRPITEVKLLHDIKNIYIFFHVEDRYIRASCTNYQERVCNDSCVECFLMPSLFDYDDVYAEDPPQYRGYFNIEINSIGTMLLYYIEDWRRAADGFEKYTSVPEEFARQITIFHSLTERIEMEIETPVTWEIGYALPFSLLETYLGPLDIRKGKPWKGNFYKCGDQTSHPHWASWSPIGETLNFHQPQYFGTLEFGM